MSCIIFCMFMLIVFIFYLYLLDLECFKEFNNKEVDNIVGLIVM